MSPGATLTKEAPDALRTPDGLLPPVNDFARTQGRRQDDFIREPSRGRAAKMGIAPTCLARLIRERAHERLASVV